MAGPSLPRLNPLPLLQPSGIPAGGPLSHAEPALPEPITPIKAPAPVRFETSQPLGEFMTAFVPEPHRPAHSMATLSRAVPVLPTVFSPSHVTAAQPAAAVHPGASVKPKKKVLIFSPPFAGHLNILKALIHHCGEQCDFKVVVTGWTNIKPNVADLAVNVFELAKSDLHETDPALWTFQRAHELLGDSLSITKEFAPDLVIYDFFSIEGCLAAKTLNIPHWCSIPALLGPMSDPAYLKNKLADERNVRALRQIKETHGLAIDQEKIEMVSDGFLMPGQVNLVWSYPDVTPPEFKKNRASDDYVFVGNIRGAEGVKKRDKQGPPLVYFSLGTVVMDNLWNQQESTREKLRQFIGSVAEAWKDKPFTVIFVTQGKKVLEEYPKNWQVFDQVDQVDVLSKADVFVTHGGNNSFHEAVLQQVPMAVIPFFGDQPLVAQRVADLGIGVNLVDDTDIDTAKSKDFLTPDLAAKLDQVVQGMLGNSSFSDAYGQINVPATIIGSLIEGKIGFREGDLLYGTNSARARYVKDTNSQPVFRMGEFRPFSELAPGPDSLPRIVDIYNDSLRDPASLKQDLASGYPTYTHLLEGFRYFLNGETDIANMCVRGLDFFSALFRVHFIVDDFDPSKNFITAKEVQHVLSHENRFRDSVIFYHNVHGAWVPLDYAQIRLLMGQSPDKVSGLRIPKLVRGGLGSRALDSFLMGPTLVTSTNPLKLGAVLAGLRENHPGSSVLVEGSNTKTGLNEQLEGLEEIVFGVTQGLETLERQIQARPTPPLLVGMSNGIYREGRDWLDTGIVVLKDASGRTAVARSRGVEIPEVFVEEARRRGFVRTTAGQIIAEQAQNPAVATDPHSYLTKGRLHRADLLAEAFVQALQQLEEPK